jgi:hypothetical protein
MENKFRRIPAAETLQNWPFVSKSTKKKRQPSAASFFTSRKNLSELQRRF